MMISTVLDHIDCGHMALPEFQRGYVWNRDQVRGQLDSRYRRHPVGGLLVWATESKSAQHRGDGQLAVFDLAWPQGVQEELSDPVAVILNEGTQIVALASQAGYRCFTSIDSFQAYVRTEIVTNHELVEA